MLNLNKQDILNNKEWKEKSYKLPLFDIDQVTENTKERPTWVHFGAGNIFRAFVAKSQQHLLNTGKADTGIIVCETFDEEIVEKAYRPFDNLSLAVTLKSTGEIEKEVVASVVESVVPSKDYERLEEIFRADSLQMVSFTITEKGYALRNANGELLPWIKNDMEQPNERSTSTLGILVKLCYERFKANAAPIALISMDNCSHNGTILKNSVMEYVEAWVQQGACEEEFRTYIQSEKVSFNWSMIDKITPQPAEVVTQMLKEDGYTDVELIKTSKGGYTASFVNAEESQYLAIEDTFPNGKMALEEVGILFSDKETIDNIEKMKVCTCLNPLHTALAIYGCVLDYKFISDEMKDDLLKSFVKELGYVEGMPVVVNPGIINAKDFIDEVIETRFPNPFVPDTPQRIATDTSKKLPIRFGETLKAYMAKGESDLSNLTAIPLVFAGWLRYLLGVNDKGEVFEISPDPNLEKVKVYLEGIKYDCAEYESGQLKELLADEEIFGVDLYTCNLATKVEDLFKEMLAGKGAIRATLEKYIEQK